MMWSVEGFSCIHMYTYVNNSSNHHKIETDTPETEVQWERVCVRLD